jgi:hypothetical protein
MHAKQLHYYKQSPEIRLQQYQAILMESLWLLIKRHAYSFTHSTIPNHKKLITFDVGQPGQPPAPLARAL